MHKPAKKSRTNPMPTPRDKPLATDLARTLAQKLRDGQLVLFAGAGLSHLALAKDGSDRRIPLWDGLTEAVSGRFGFDIQDFSNSPLDLFDAVTHAHSRGELETAVRETLDDRDFELSPAHHALAELPWHSVITTNYDGLLSRPFSHLISANLQHRLRIRDSGGVGYGFRSKPRPRRCP